MSIPLSALLQMFVRNFRLKNTPDSPPIFHNFPCSASLLGKSILMILHNLMLVNIILFY
jgi:hypothetical protein